MVIEADAIQITDEDILNAMSFSLYQKKYSVVVESAKKELEELTDKLLKELELRHQGKGSITTYSIGGIEFLKQDDLSMLFFQFNNFKSSMYITDTFLVTEVNEDYFKVGLLNDYQRKRFYESGKLVEINKFLHDLKLPHYWEYKKFFRLGCKF